ncbi:MAG TPA: DUF5335 family protein [Candidatus Xenobia bacterium]|jgi:hypothetical protein
MATREISRYDWPVFLAELMERYGGRPCRMELLGSELGAQLATHGLPLAAIEADIKHSKAQISLLIGDQADQHVTHIIDKPTHVRIREVTSSSAATLQIESEGGITTLLSIEQTG